MNIPYKPLTEYTEFVQKVFKKEFEKSFNKTKKQNPDIELDFAGPNIIFGKKEVRFQIEGYRFKPNSDHTKFENLVEESFILIKFGRHDMYSLTDESLEAAVKTKLGIALEELKYYLGKIKINKHA